MSGGVPLPTLLSQTLVAFTIELDNEAEHQLPHWTTNFGAGGGHSNDLLFRPPWLVSIAMWFNCLQFVDEKGITVRRLEQLARTKTNLNGMERWGYVAVEPDPADRVVKPPRSSWLIRPTRAGQCAKDVWRPLLAAMEDRWRKRFGKQEIEGLRQSLSALIRKIDMDLPDCLPILGYGLFSLDPKSKLKKPSDEQPEAVDSLPLPALLSKVLLAFAIEFEKQSEVSLAIGANVLRIIENQAVLMRDLPGLAGVSKEAIAGSLNFLRSRRLAAVKTPSDGSRNKVAELTPEGQEAAKTYHRLLPAIEHAWRTRFGAETVQSLRDALQPLVGTPDAETSPLFAGLGPYPDGWRARLPRRTVLPHFPMVLHRGGFPDGS